jgi:ADP-ribose pyrophosphatase
MLSPWSVLSSEVLLHCPPWLTVERQHLRTPSGKDIPAFYLRTGRDSVVIVAADAVGRVKLVRQYKHAVGRVCMEFPAGYLELGEAPLACAQRELREETGCHAGEWMRLGVLAREPHTSPTVMHFYLARGLMRVGEPQPDATEELAVCDVWAGEIPALLADGELPSVYCAAAWALAAPYLKEYCDGNPDSR